MKKIFTILAAAAAFSLASCSKEQIEAPSTDFKLDIQVADLDGTADTKAMKKGWVSGDRINLWYEGNAQRDPDLVIRYDGSKWAKDADAKVSGNEPAASGNIFYVYDGGNDLSAYDDRGDDCYYGTMNLLYGDRPSKPTQYSFSEGTLSFNIEHWMPVTEFQVVVTGIDDPSRYQLKCSNLETLSGFRVAGSSTGVVAGIYDGYVSGVTNADGAAFYFLSAKDGTAEASYVFVLKNIETNELKTYTVSGKVHDYNGFTAVKLDNSKLGHSYVDLGLSVKWASMNIGAERPEDYGDYFAWGENESKTDETFTWGNYKWMQEGKSEWRYINKYTFADGQVDGIWYSGNTFVGDSKKNLADYDYIDDAARQIWKSDWRIPTRAEWHELKENCDWTWTEDYKGTGIAGRIVTSRMPGYEGNSIFLPAAGIKDEGGINSRRLGSDGNYWCSSVAEERSDLAMLMSIDKTSCGFFTTWRYRGLSVRPVKE